MVPSSMAIIGTAGRKEDQHLLANPHYDRMVNAAISLIDHLKCDRKTLKMVSGGAAWADHIVVSLALKGVVDPKNVTIFMPANLSTNGYSGSGDLASRTASTANYYHRLFSNCVKIDSINELIAIGKQGAVLVPGNGSFHARNTSVAKFVSPDGILFALTSGDPNHPQEPWSMRSFDPSTSAADGGLKDGGTADTWNKSTCLKWHCKIGRMR
jgi:hypothetical protein